MRWLWVLVICTSLPTFIKASKALPMLLQTSWSTLKWYSSEILRVLSTLEEMSIMQMRRTRVCGPPSVES